MEVAKHRALIKEFDEQIMRARPQEQEVLRAERDAYARDLAKHEGELAQLKEDPAAANAPGIGDIGAEVDVERVINDALESNETLADLLTSDHADEFAALIKHDPQALRDLQQATQNPELTKLLARDDSLEAIYLRQALAERLVSPAELRAYVGTQFDLSALLGRSPEQMARTIKLNGRTDVVGQRAKPLDTPEGTVHAIRPDGEVVTVNYEDHRHKHTRAANHTLERLEEIAQADPKTLRGGEEGLRKKLQSGDVQFGGQLSREAAGRYHDLLREALENGLWVKQESGVTKIYYQFEEPVGIELGSSSPQVTRWVRIDTSPGADGALSAAHIIPMTPPPSIQKEYANRLR